MRVAFSVSQFPSTELLMLPQLGTNAAFFTDAIATGAGVNTRCNSNRAAHKLRCYYVRVFGAGM